MIVGGVDYRNPFAELAFQVTAAWGVLLSQPALRRGGVINPTTPGPHGPIFWMGLLVPDFSFFAGLAYFSPDLRVYATSAAPPATTHPSIKEAAFGRLHKVGAAAHLCGFL